jgi:anti-sigma regulatory factor (Ser/Thr protein kinase)
MSFEQRKTNPARPRRVQPVDDSTPAGVSHRLEVRADVGGQARGLRWVTSLGVCWGLGLAVRARIGTAVSEILDNAVRHAYLANSDDGESGRRVVVLVARDAKAVRITIRDFGKGCDGHTLTAAMEPPPGLFALGVLPSGLRRARCLTDAMNVRSDAFGTRVHMSFETHGAAWSADALDHSDDDYLTARSCRALVAAIRAGDDACTQHLPPHLAVVVGRILSAAPAA